ncbi:MAG TPA: DUF2934 domain-containing protein [Methylophilaceae bacterium]|nr:DUF2934 domain-containing protein [Methylophilaceae bacterium]HAJ72794.1 DUF2934 domain-containing protein [Methylophilaceae bacterium]
MAAEKSTTKKTTSEKPKAAPKKVATSKTATNKTTTSKTLTEKKPAAKKTTSKKKTEPVSGFERYKMIEVAAYYLAEKNGFAGDAASYWIAAEMEFDKK